MSKEYREQRDRYADRENWAVPSPADLLEMTAPAIEAAGSIQRAVRLGVIGGAPMITRQLERLVPESRGGRWKHPKADELWNRIVQRAVRSRDLDLEGMKRFLASLPDPN